MRTGKSMKNELPKLRRSLFWDIDEKDIEKAYLESSQWVINRIFEYGEIEEILSVIKFYGRNHTKDVLRNSELRPMARTMAFLLLDVKGNKPTGKQPYN
jgi:antitoxin HigA-1